jgi:hypothetical protein
LLSVGSPTEAADWPWTNNKALERRVFDVRTCKRRGNIHVCRELDIVLEDCNR